MIKARFYCENEKALWDNFVQEQGLFFQFQRDYIQYPGRFLFDRSLIITHGDEVVALFVACRVDSELISSHYGLSYGGLLLSQNDETNPRNLWQTVERFYVENGYKKLKVRPLPFFYAHEKQNSDFFKNFELSKREELVWIDLGEELGLKKLRKRSILKSMRAGAVVGQETNLPQFWQQLELDLMTRHQAKPVHSLFQIHYLSRRFQDNIKLYSYKLGDEILAGVVVFIDQQTAHLQYIFSSQKGRQIGAIDGLVYFLVELYRAMKLKILSLGTSTDPSTLEPNGGLLSWKKGWSQKSCFVETFTKIL